MYNTAIYEVFQEVFQNTSPSCVFEHEFNGIEHPRDRFISACWVPILTNGSDGFIKDVYSPGN